MIITHRLSCVCFCTALTLGAPAGQANDIVDFLRAIRGVDRHHHGGHPGFGRGSRDPHFIAHRSRRSYDRFGGRSVSIQIGNQYPQPFIPAPAPPIFAPPLPHALGEFVTCAVPLATHVHVKNAHEIAPGAQPVVMAVRDPFLPEWGTPGCVEQLAYVQIFVPPVPLRQVEISPCHTRIKLDYGHWEIEIRSCHGVIEVEYDD